MNIEQQIQNWIFLDNQLKQINEKSKQLREQKNKIANILIANVENKKLENISVALGSDKLRVVSTNIIQPITFKYVETCLKEIIKNESQVQLIIDYIKTKREIKQEMDIKRFKK